MRGHNGSSYTRNTLDSDTSCTLGSSGTCRTLNSSDTWRTLGSNRTLGSATGRSAATPYRCGRRLLLVEHKGSGFSIYMHGERGAAFLAHKRLFASLYGGNAHLFITTRTNPSALSVQNGILVKNVFAVPSLGDANDSKWLRLVLFCCNHNSMCKAAAKLSIFF